MAPNLNSGLSQLPSSFTLALPHYATLSTSQQAEVMESQEDFVGAYGRIGTTEAQLTTLAFTTQFSALQSHCSSRAT